MFDRSESQTKIFFMTFSLPISLVWPKNVNDLKFEIKYALR